MFCSSLGYPVVIRKGSVDTISDGTISTNIYVVHTKILGQYINLACLYIVDWLTAVENKEHGCPRRCGGQGDVRANSVCDNLNVSWFVKSNALHFAQILAGSIATFAAWVKHAEMYVAI